MLDFAALRSLKTDTVMTQLARVLAPYVGATMAEASARAQAQKLGVTGPVISGEHVEALIGKLGSGLAIFVGRQKSVLVVEEMRQAVAAAAGASE